MRSIFTIARRELAAYFTTPVGWLCLCGWIAIQGVFFAIGVLGYNAQSMQMGMNPYGQESMNINEVLLPEIFGNTSVILLFLCPALAMWLISEDRMRRSFEMLLASPMNSTQIVLGKYLGALGFLAVMQLSTLHLVALLYWFGNPDAGVLLGSYGGTFLVGAAFLAVGLFASSLTEHQVVALVLGFGFLLGLWVVPWASSFSDGTLSKVLSYVAVPGHQEDLSKGLLHLKDAIYFGTFIGFFLFATQQRVEAYRWQ